MYARVGQLKIKPGKRDEYVDGFNEMGSTTREQPGYKGTTLLIYETTNTATMISLWETEELARAVETSAGSINKRFAAIADFVEDASSVDVKYMHVPVDRR